MLFVRVRIAASLSMLASLLLANSAHAQPSEGEEQVPHEELDQTRLDVERLPPEAITITRNLYSHGFFLEAQMGARVFLNGVGNYIDAGPWASAGLGYEILSEQAIHFVVLLSAEGSMHRTDAPPPPSPTAFEIVGGTATGRFQFNFTAEFAASVAGQFGVMVATTDILNLYGFQNASTIGICYGGEAGLDWHFRARHHSIGLLGGARHYPSLEGITGGSPSLAVHAAAYIRYVF